MEYNDINFKPKKHIAIVEAGRGIAAIYVFIYHIIKFTDLLNALPKESFQYYLAYTFGIYGHEAVLFFFLLSGFSVHYSSLDRQLNTTRGISKYYYLRFRRIYPIYLLAIGLTLSLLYTGYYLYPIRFNDAFNELSLQGVFYNLTFLSDRYYIEGIISRALPTNGPLWSLSYEVLYYLLYPLYWLLNSRFGQIKTLLICSLISIVSITYSRFFDPNHFTNILSLYILWALGACVAQLYRSGVVDKKVKPSYMLFIIFILFQSVWVLENATYTLGVYYQIIWGLLFFSIMLYFVILDDVIRSKNEKIYLAILFISGTMFIDIISNFIQLSNDMKFFYFKIHFTLFSFLVFSIFDKFSLKKTLNMILMPFEKAGSYSYALYIIHYPILFFLNEVLRNYGMNPLIAILILPIIIYLAKYIEGDYQIFMKNKLDRLFT